MALNERVILAALVEIANKMAQTAKSNASWSKSIPKAISVREPQILPNGYSIDIVVDLREGIGAPQARAFEFGSGIHATRGTKGTYKIKPKNAKALAFQWNPANPIGALSSSKVIDYLVDKDIWLFSEVDHPGVAQNEFMRPAIIAHLPEARKKISTSLKALLVLGNKVEVIG